MEGSRSRVDICPAREALVTKFAWVFLPFMLVAQAVEAQSGRAPVARQPVPAQSAQQPTTAPQPQAVPAQALNPVAQTLNNAGAQRCAARANQVTNFLSASNQVGTFLFLPEGNAESRILAASMEIRSANNVVSYGSVNFAPVGSDGCGATYDVVTYWQNTCADVATRAYAQLPQVGVLQNQIRVLDGGGQMRIFLMPAGAGCISIKKEVIF